jgi:hypothetical protein
MQRRISRQAPAGGTPTMSVIGELPPGARYLQLWNPTSEVVTLWIDQDGSGPVAIETATANHVSALLTCPPSDTRIGCTRAAGAAGSSKLVWLMVS